MTFSGTLLDEHRGATGGAKVREVSKYGFLLHAEPYVGSSGSSHSISFDNVVGGLFRISISALGQNFFDLCTDTVNRILRKALSLHLWSRGLQS